MATRITNNFTLEELTHSDTAKAYKIDNTPTPQARKNLYKLAEEVLQPIRDIYGHSIIVNSAYRCEKLNAKVKGAKTSQHLTGEAADIRCTATSMAVLFGIIKDMVRSGRLQVGQLIWEHGDEHEPAWIHVSLPRTNGKPNNQILYLYS